MNGLRESPVERTFSAWLEEGFLGLFEPEEGKAETTRHLTLS